MSGAIKGPPWLSVDIVRQISARSFLMSITRTALQRPSSRSQTPLWSKKRRDQRQTAPRHDVGELDANNRMDRLLHLATRQASTASRGHQPIVVTRMAPARLRPRLHSLLCMHSPPTKQHARAATVLAAPATSVCPLRQQPLSAGHSSRVFQLPPSHLQGDVLLQWLDL